MGFISFFSCLMNNVIKNEENYYRFMRAWSQAGHLVIKKNDIKSLAHKIQTEHDLDIYRNCWTIVENTAFNQTNNYVCWDKKKIFDTYFAIMSSRNENRLYDTTNNVIDVDATTTTEERIKLFKECIYELAKTSNNINIIDSYAIAVYKNRRALNKVASTIKNINKKSNIVLYTKYTNNNQQFFIQQVRQICNNITDVSQFNILRDNVDIHDRYIIFNNRAVRMSRGVLDVMHGYNKYFASWNYLGQRHPYNNMRKLNANIAYTIKQ